MRIIVSTLLVIAVTVCPLVNGQEPSQQKPDVVVRFRTNEVRLDIVVKDKKGHLVNDLTARDFEVSEDGVTQQIQSFRFVNREGLPEMSPNSNPENKPESSQPAATNRSSPGITALVFDRLSPEARSLARKAG